MHASLSWLPSGDELDRLLAAPSAEGFLGCPLNADELRQRRLVIEAARYEKEELAAR